MKTSANPPMRPRDAASLVIVRHDKGRPQVLMGERHAAHVFMPGVFVFPGGRVDAGDSRVTPASDLNDATYRRLLARMNAPASRVRARALAMAAVREAFEETGLIVGAPAGSRTVTRSAGWKPFFATGNAPALEHLCFAYRAITPPGRTRRFDARFFLVDARHVSGELKQRGDGSDELLDLKWLTIDEALAHRTVQVTRHVLQEIAARHLKPGLLETPHQVPFRYRRRGKLIIEQI